MKKNLLVAACARAITLTPDQKYLALIPEGRFRGVDGRPHDAPEWVLTPENGRLIAAALNKQSIDMVIDYEHATLHAKKTGKAAPASGWARAGKFEYVDSVGLCSAEWKWTAKAADHIEAEEYRYLSPVLLYTKTGEVVGLLNAALTNTPCLDVLPEVLLAAASQVFYVQQPEESSVDKEQLAALGLPEDATKEQVMAKIAALNTAALSQQAPAEPDPAKYVPIGMYNAAQAKIVGLTGEVKTKEADDLITAALSDGRLLGEDAEKWARAFAERDFDGFKQHIEAAPKVAALSQQQSKQTQQQQPAPAGQLDDVTAAIAAQMGVDAADISKFGAQA